jgi:hypothetical protein
MLSEGEDGIVKSFYWRRFVALTTGLSLFAVGFTGLVLFIAPPGRFVHGGNWLLLGMTKQQFLHTHMLLAILLMIFSLWHMYFNWNTIAQYLTNRNQKVITLEFFVSLLLVSFVFFCS